MGFKNYHPFVSKLTTFYTAFDLKLKEIQVQQVLSRLSKNFFLSWLISYIFCIASILLANSLTNVPVLVPFSLEFVLSSYWGASIVISLFLTLLLKTFLGNALSINDFLEVDDHIVSIKKTSSVVAIFFCSPPILHDKNDFSFLMENFQPFSIELHPAQEDIYFLLYGQKGPAFQNKIQECSNLLNSFFSSVQLLSNGSAKKFVALGLDFFTAGPLADEVFFSKTDLKKLNNTESFTIVSQTNEASLSSAATGARTAPSDPGQPFVFLLSLLGSRGSNNITKSGLPHLFRGIKVGPDVTTTPSHTFGSPLQTKNITNAICALARIPEKNSAQADASELNKMYFYILHKFFRYHFRDLDHPAQDADSSSSLVYTRNNNEMHDLDSTEPLETGPEKSSVGQVNQSLTLDDSFQIDQVPSSMQSDINIEEESNPAESLRKEFFVDLKKVSFQFTQFCHLYCPALNDEFRKKTTSMVNNFAIPNGCYEHIVRSNEHFFDFFNVQHNNLDPKVIFRNPAFRESFLEFIQVKEMDLIDKICHISSLIILSPNNFDIQENDIFSVVQTLEKDFF